MFVDGFNEEKQVLRYIHNSLRNLARDGSILLNACNPDAEANQLTDLACGSCLELPGKPVHASVAAGATFRCRYWTRTGEWE